MISVNIFGFPCPFDAFMHCPTKNPKRFTFPDLYSATWEAFSTRTASTMASSAQVSLVCLSQSFVTHSSALPHSKTSFSMTAFEFVEESSSAFTICMTRANSSTGDFRYERYIFS